MTMPGFIELPSQPVQSAMLFIFLFLFGVSLWLFFSKYSRSLRQYTELMQRVYEFGILVLLLALSLILSPTYAVLFWAIVSYLALKAFFTSIPARQIDQRVLFWAYLTIPLQFYFIATLHQYLFALFIPVFVFLFIPLRMVSVGEVKGFMRAVSSIHWGVMLMVYGISSIAALYMLDAQKNPMGGISGFVLYLLVLNQLNDAAQFFWDQRIGSDKMLPALHATKTLEGFLAATTTTITFAVLLAPLLTPLSLCNSFFAGLLIALASCSGDVIMSALKRDLDIKDIGSMVSGYGGVMDRMDGLLFTAPLYFYFIRYVCYA